MIFQGPPSLPPGFRRGRPALNDASAVQGENAWWVQQRPQRQYGEGEAVVGGIIASEMDGRQAWKSVFIGTATGVAIYLVTNALDRIFKVRRKT